MEGTIIVRVENFATKMIEQVKTLVIDSEEKLKEVADMLASIKIAESDLEKERKSLVAPLNQHVKAINLKYKPISTPLAEAKGILNDKVIAYHREKEAEAAKEQARLRREETLKQKKLDEEKAELEKKGIKLNIPVQEEAAPPVVAGPEKTTSGIHSKMTIRKRPAFRLVDFAAVPDKYKVLNEPKVNEAARNGVKNIEGMEWYEKESVANR